MSIENEYDMKTNHKMNKHYDLKNTEWKIKEESRRIQK
mgnify:CR=1 FL=1